MRNALIETLKTTWVIWVSIPLGVAGIIGIYNSTIHHFLDSHSMLGWLLLALVIVFGTFLWNLKNQLPTHSQEQRKDYLLLTERLGSWTVDGPFTSFMHHSVSHDLFPEKISDEIDDKCRQWDIDSRAIFMQKTSKLYENLKMTLTNYRNALADELDTWDTGTGADRQFKEGYLRVPPEWELEQSERYHLAYSRLQSTRSKFVDALDSLLTELHRISPSSS